MATGTPLKDVFRFDKQGSLPLPGRIGRLVRGMLGVVLVKFVYDWLTIIDSTDFGNPFILLWILFSVALAPYVVNIGFGVNLGAIPRYALLGAWGVAGLAGWALESRPDSEFLWTLIEITQIYIYGHLGVSFVLSAILATPGCEMRAIPQLLGKISGSGSREHYCPGFIDTVDRWERDLKKVEGGTAEKSEDAPADPLPRVQFLSFEGCPLAAETRNVLERALKHVGRQTDDFQEVDVLDPATPPELAGWGSPTILVNGRDVAGHNVGDAPGCRVYDSPDRLPREEWVVNALLHTGRT